MNEKDNIRKTPPLSTIASVIGGLLFILQVALCLLAYDSAGLDWLTYLGWVMIAVSLILGWRARIAFETKGKVASGSWLHTSNVVDSGVYGIIRHPMYLSFLLIILACAFMSQHWLSVISGIYLLFLLYNIIRQEEKSNLEKFGDEYQQYMQKVPRVNFVIGFIRFLERRTKGQT